MPESIEKAGQDYLLSKGELQVLITPNQGGRIASLRYGERELLITPDQHESWGNVFWTSPQSDWGWPPPAALDHKPYKVDVTERALVLTSDVDSRLGYQVRKSYRPGSRDGELVIDYRLYNRSAKTRWVAPWEVTRVAAAGLTFFPKGEGEFISGAFQPLPVDVIAGIVWFDYRPELIQPGHHKLMADGAEGWLAWANRGYLLLKQFDDVPAARNAPGEGEVEIFANQDRRFIELEQQGPYTQLAPGESLDWQVRWIVAPLPQHLAIAAGNPALVEWVRKIIKQSGRSMAGATNGK